ncbi:hypothetical protein [Actinoplanes subtropicus]|uniref:hypothetical protein n=1 Tax=Actinoplanes subtropicus TaxID=543632 RepID=UPI0004C34DBB|nr:hypothetical protein [Actinoplanes subtropicus]
MRLVDAPDDARGLLDDLLTEDPRFADADTFALRWDLVTAFDPGSFLHATLFAAQILNRWAPAEATAASLHARWQRKPPIVPSDLDTAIELAVPRGVARRVLVALAHTGGDGAPIEVIAALDPVATHEALRGCRLLVWRDHSADGVVVFRLRHAVMASALAGEALSLVYARLHELVPSWHSVHTPIRRSGSSTCVRRVSWT